MRKIILVLMVFAFYSGMSQRIAYVEIQKILDQMPEYKAASEKIDEQVKQWNAEVEQKFKEVDDLYQDYVKNEMGFSQDVKVEKQNSVVEAEKQAKEFREKFFGQNGELKQLQEKNLKPLEEKVLQTAEKVGKENNYEYVFDKRTDSFWVYTNPEHNITEKVILELQMKNQ
jgi:outer membrane protein